MSTFDPPYGMFPPVPHAFRSRLLIWSGLAAAYWALIFLLTHLPISVPGGANSLDKLQHAGAFFGLAVLLCAAYNAWRPRQEWGYLGVLLAAGCYGALDELTQALVPNRYSDFRDWLADLGGAALGVGVMFLLAAFWRDNAAAAADASAVASAEVKTR